MPNIFKKVYHIKIVIRINKSIQFSQIDNNKIRLITFIRRNYL